MKYFLNLEKNRAKTKSMTILIEENGTVIFDQKIKSQKQVDFYSKLYMKDPRVEFNYVNWTGVRVSESEHEELTFALKSSSRGKSPGLDGLTVEFVFFLGETGL